MIKLKDLLLEVLYGKRLEILTYLGNILPTVVSKNTREGELPFRLTWFSPSHKQPLGHIELNKQEADDLIFNKKISNKTLEKIKNFIDIRDILW